MPASDSNHADLALRIGGTVIGVALAAVTALWEAVLTTWYVIISGHVIRLPVAPLLAVIANLGLVWFTYKVTRRIGLTLLPGLAWLAVMFAAGDLTSDGDLIVTGTWVGLTTILLGAVSWAAAAYLLIGRVRDTVPKPPAQPVGRTPKATSTSAATGARPTASAGGRKRAKR